MRDALIADFSRITGVEVRTMDSIASDYEDHFRRLAATSDWTIVVAPEFDDILVTQTRWVVQSSGRLLGPAPAAVALAADKRRLACALLEKGVPTPAVWGVGDSPLSPPPWVMKPRYGAGSQATFLIRDADELANCLELARQENGDRENLIQPYVAGQPASVAFLTGPREVMALWPCSQYLSNDGRFRYRGGSCPLDKDSAKRAIALGRRALDVFSGWCGYVGVDLVLGANQTDDTVLEINPRVTTSYIGLRALARTNLANVMVRLATGRDVSPIRWDAKQVGFGSDGNVTKEAAG
jgi:hypothetical protein